MKRKTIVYEDHVINGFTRRVPVVIERDYGIPFTPQLGEDTKTHVLSHIVACHRSIKHDDIQRLSKLKTGNPFDMQVFGGKITEVANKVESYKKSRNKSEK